MCHCGCAGCTSAKRFTPGVLKRLLPETVPMPATGSVDWLNRNIGKIGHHFTRALVTIVKTHLEAERVALEAGNHDLIDRHAQDAFLEYVRRTP